MTRRGLTIVEVLVALVVIVVAFSILSTALVGNLQQTQRAGTRTQTTQYLAYFGRKVAGGDPAVLAAVGSPLTWGYGALASAFDDLPSGGGDLADVSRYRAEVEQVGSVAFVGASAVHYRIVVCATGTTGEACATGNTLGPPPTPGGTPPLLPGIN